MFLQRTASEIGLLTFGALLLVLGAQGRVHRIGVDSTNAALGCLEFGM